MAIAASPQSGATGAPGALNAPGNQHPSATPQLRDAQTRRLAEPSEPNKPNKRRVKRWAYLAAILALGGLVAWGLVPKPIAVEMAAVARGPFVVALTQQGKARVRELYAVRAPLSGRLSRVEVKAGAQVEPGQVLAEIYPVDPPLLDAKSRAAARARVNAAAAARRRAEATLSGLRPALRHAQDELSTTRSLRAQGIVSQAALQQAELVASQAEAELEAAAHAAARLEHEVELARTELNHAEGGSAPGAVRAPVAGTVLRVHRESSGPVTRGQPLLELGDPAQLELVVDLLTRDAVRVEVGAAVAIGGWGGEPLTGRVVRVEPAAYTRLSSLGVEEQRVDVVVELLSPPSAYRQLKDGFQVEVSITVWEGEQVVSVPASALFRNEGRWAVYSLLDGRAHLTHVELGEHNGRRAQILEGLSPGDAVIVHPGERIDEGTRVVGQ